MLDQLTDAEAYALMNFFQDKGTPLTTENVMRYKKGGDVIKNILAQYLKDAKEEDYVGAANRLMSEIRGETEADDSWTKAYESSIGDKVKDFPGKRTEKDEADLYKDYTDEQLIAEADKLESIPDEEMKPVAAPEPEGRLTDAQLQKFAKELDPEFEAPKQTELSEDQLKFLDKEYTEMETSPFKDMDISDADIEKAYSDVGDYGEGEEPSTGEDTGPSTEITFGEEEPVKGEDVTEADFTGANVYGDLEDEGAKEIKEAMPQATTVEKPLDVATSEGAYLQPDKTLTPGEFSRRGLGPVPALNARAESKVADPEEIGTNYQRLGKENAIAKQASELADMIQLYVANDKEMSKEARQGVLAQAAILKNLSNQRFANVKDIVSKANENFKSYNMNPEMAAIIMPAMNSIANSVQKLLPDEKLDAIDTDERLQQLAANPNRTAKEEQEFMRLRKMRDKQIEKEEDYRTRVFRAKGDRNQLQERYDDALSSIERRKIADAIVGGLGKIAAGWIGNEYFDRPIPVGAHFKYKPRDFSTELTEKGKNFRTQMQDINKRLNDLRKEANASDATELDKLQAASSALNALKGVASLNRLTHEQQNEQVLNLLGSFGMSKYLIDMLFKEFQAERDRKARVEAAKVRPARPPANVTVKNVEGGGETKTLTDRQYASLIAFNQDPTFADLYGLPEGRFWYELARSVRPLGLTEGNLRKIVGDWDKLEENFPRYYHLKDVLIAAAKANMLEDTAKLESYFRDDRTEKGGSNLKSPDRGSPRAESLGTETPEEYRRKQKEKEAATPKAPIFEQSGPKPDKQSTPTTGGMLKNINGVMVAGRIVDKGGKKVLVVQTTSGVQELSLDDPKAKEYLNAPEVK